MGRSTPSCFKIISCGNSNQAVDRDDIDASTENKSPDKRGWSFRKRSARHRVLSNTVVTEKITSSDNKPISEPITNCFEPHVTSNISEKTSDNIWTEEISNSVTKNAADSTVVTTKSGCEEDSIKCEPVSDRSESAILVIQAAVRRFLAERQLVKQKNVVKLQAAVRGHLVRNHAVGTLRCVQAIVKMQALVRARRKKGEQNARINTKPTYISIEKLLSNKFARQLLESTPNTKQFNIKCDPSKSDSAWKWLERWMSVSSPDGLESHAPDHDKGIIVNNSENENLIHIDETSTGKSHEDEPTENQIEVSSVIENHVSETKPEPIPENPVSEIKPDPILENIVSETEPDPILENPVLETKPEPILENLESENKLIVENPVSEPKPEPIPENPESETEPKRIAKRVATDQPDSEKRKSVFGSRKASNPAFIAAQSRFEELTSLTKPLTSSSNQDDVSGPGSIAVEPEQVTQVPDVEPDEHLVSHGSITGQTGGSECGTVLSVTSTLDSPDQSEVENKKPDEPKVLNETVSDMNMNMNMNDDNNINENIEQVNHHTNKSNNHQPFQQITASESPRSHITVPESQGTPSSQVSTNNTKKSKTDKKSTSQKRKSWSTSKKSSVDSALRTSLEQLPKDPKPGKRRNSFGSPKPDNNDQEPLVPSYMQATESARAKAVANISPALSPDVHDKETYLKKRHSLPGAVNGRQGSPRIQRSMSQALQTAKGNGNQERKWQR